MLLGLTYQPLFCSEATFIVTKATDTIDKLVQGELRWAITQANNTAFTQDASKKVTQIKFHIPQDNPQDDSYINITLNDALPPIEHQVIIDGYSQPGSQVATEDSPAKLKIKIVANADTNHMIDGFVINDDTYNSPENFTEIKGLSIKGFRAGILLNNTRFCSIAGNHIGLSPANGSSISTDGLNYAGIVGFNSSNIHIGSADAADRNVISGNTGFGVLLLTCHKNIIEGNYVGTDATGKNIVENNTGMRLEISADTDIIGNVISGNQYAGIHMNIARENNIEKNYIGLAQDGSTVLPNGTGVYIESSTLVNIGGILDVNKRNVISGNTARGIFIENLGPACKINYNYIGLDADGMRGKGNGIGIELGNCGNALVLQNYIADNTIGCFLHGDMTRHNTIKENFFGIGINGEEIPNEQNIKFLPVNTENNNNIKKNWYRDSGI